MAITTKNLKQILNSDHTIGINGKDYGCPAIKAELEAELYYRLTRDSELEAKLLLKQADEYEDYLRSQAYTAIRTKI